MRFVVFDVETPNSANNRMSAIGVSVVEDMEIVHEFATLVNPETHFDRFNIELTGITPEMVKDAPTFSELWEAIEPIFSDGIMVAHNAPFDMGVLARCLRAYKIAWVPYAQYACTVRMSKACFPQLCNHRLNTVSSYLGIELDHHKASSDAHACAEILCRCLQCGVELRRFLRAYDLQRCCTLGGNWR